MKNALIVAALITLSSAAHGQANVQQPGSSPTNPNGGLLIGNGGNGAASASTNGGNGGLLFGNGGSGGTGARSGTPGNGGDGGADARTGNVENGGKGGAGGNSGGTVKHPKK